ncbi:hypothetical protein BC941DRAFT_407450 [Chlamydoabsidia padenii]|nr:hypothetical protein BC941DRAFT_407450 [Chlamydoabsidia padenii]
MTLLSSQIKWTHRHICFIILCTTGLFIFFTHFYTSSHYDPPHTTVNKTSPKLTAKAHQRHSLYTPSNFVPDALLYNNFRPISAIVLRTSNDENSIHTIVNYLYKYPFIKEITIYNLVSPLSTQAFERPNNWLLHKVDIHIIQGPDDDGILALFSTCALSNYGYCYLQADQTRLNTYLDTLYTQFLQHPDLVHVNVPSEVYLTHRRWQLTDNRTIHTGYANLRHGAIIPRTQAQLFMNQLAVQKPSLEQKRHADILFSVWMNTYPYLLSNPYPLVSDPAPHFQPMLDALQGLQVALTHHMPYFVENDIDLPLNQRDVRTACENDKCLFVTNIDPFPITTTYNPHQNLTNYSLESTSAWQHELGVDIPSPEFWYHRGYHAAVDGNSGTCWNTYLVPKEGDYFGLDLIGSIRVSRLVVYLRQHQEPFFKVRALTQKQIWVDCSIVIDPSQTLARRMVFHMNCPDPIISAIRLFFTKQHTNPLDICGLGLDNFII